MLEPETAAPDGPAEADALIGESEVLALAEPELEASDWPEPTPPILPPAVAAVPDALDPALFEPSQPLAPDLSVDLSADLPADLLTADLPTADLPAADDAVLADIRPGRPADGEALDVATPSGIAEATAPPELASPVLPPALAAVLDAADPVLLDFPQPTVELSPELPPAEGTSATVPAAGSPAEIAAIDLDSPAEGNGAPSAGSDLALPILAAPVSPPEVAAVLDALDPALPSAPADRAWLDAPAGRAEPLLPDGLAIPDLPVAEPVVEPEVAIALAEPPPVPATPEIVAEPLLPPTIDAVEVDGPFGFVAGNGPAGALMRLHVDGIVVGESQVEAGRWLIEGSDLFTRPRHLLRVEAIDADTGEVVSSATISFEIELPEVPPVATGPEPEPGATGPAVEEDLTATPAAPNAATPSEAPLALPPIRPVVPSGETASVTILGAPAAGTILELSPASPRPPVVTASFELPAAVAAVPVLRAVPLGDPGAGRFVSGRAIIRRGDTLWDIAHRYYGRGIRFDVIYRANRDRIARPSRIYPGQVFDLPLVYDE
ncbi:MAG: LysM peptidoglycan-binding domain-containing protein [Devosia sp.]|nr:LysM peptidoglycan-binding domain-containing protein [Devosia sp.]